MNYARLAEWVRGRVEDLVEMGVPRDEAESLMKSVEFGAIAAEASARSDAQFLLDLRRTGSGVMAKRGQCTRQAVHKRSEEHTSELQSLMRIPYAGFCLKKK